MIFSKKDFGGSFTVAYKDEPRALNPLIETTSTGSTLCQVIFDGLITLTPSGKISPRIASKWKVSGDNLKWTFYLRKDVKFHDGEKLTSEDVYFTYHSILNSSPFYSSKDLFRNVKEIKKLDKYSVQFILSKPDTNFLLNLYIIGVLPKHILKNNAFTNDKFNKKPIGTGPFQVKTWKKNKSIALVSNKKYFRGRPYIDKINLIKANDMLKMWSMLQRGDIDAVYNDIMPNAFDNLKSSKNLVTYRIPDYMNYVLIFNFRKKEFQDRRMRYAINAAIDRNKIIERALSGNGIESSGVFRPGAAKISKKNTYDPEKSAQLLKELGYSDKNGDGILEKNNYKLSFTVLYDTGNALKKNVLMEMKYQLLNVGIEIICKEVTIPQIISRGKSGDFEMILFNYNHLLDIPILVWHSNGIKAGLNISNYKNQRVDRYFEQLVIEKNRQKKEALMSKIHKETVKDVAGVFLFQKYNLVAVNKKFKGFKPDADKFFWEYVTEVYFPKKYQ